MKNIESMPKFEHFPMRSGQLLSSGLESRLSDLGRVHHMFSRILKLWIYYIFFHEFFFCFFYEVEASIEIKTDKQNDNIVYTIFPKIMSGNIKFYGISRWGHYPRNRLEKGFDW